MDNMASLRVVVTGGSGVLGTALRDVRPRWTYLSRSECDVRDTIACYRTLRALSPDVVLHTAALTDHQHPNAAEVIETNIIGTQTVALACAMLGAKIAYTSTHYIYGGTTGWYTEEAMPKPIGAYAMSKWSGELVVGRNDALIVRGSWYTTETRLDHWARRGALVDAYCSREPVTDAARKIVALVEAKARGIINIGAYRRTFSQILHDEGYAAHEYKGITRAQLDAASAAPYPFPADTSVSTGKFEALGLEWKNV